MADSFDPLAQTTSVDLGTTDNDEDLVGRRVDDRFEVRALIGVGAHGAVYEAWDERHQCAVALKTLLRVAPEELVRFKQEFRVLSDVSHPNLVTLHELFVGGAGAYFTMELVKGCDFLTWARGEDLDELNEGRLRDGLRRLSRGLAALHDFGLLHRDLKPSNVLVRDDGEVLVADFGLARPLSNKDAEQGLSGTPAYMSPEQAADLELGAPSDWYSVGVMLYEALTGAYPFGGLSGMGLLMAKQLQSAGRPSRNQAGVPPDLDELCERLLAREPEARPLAREVLQLVGAVGDDEPLAGRSVGHDEGVFVGRQQELARLAGAWATVRDDIPNRRTASVLLLSGPSGVGKSALLRQFLASDVGQDAVVIRGRCYERESVPYKGLDMLVDSLRAHLLSRQAVLSAVDLPGAGALARIFPVLQDVPGIGDRATVPIEDPLEQRRQAVDALRELWRRLATLSPLLIVLDDLQWCDEDTVGFLVDLMRPQHRPPMFFIGAFRSEDAGNAVLGTIGTDLGTIDGLLLETLALHPLDMAAATELARTIMGEAGEADGGEAGLAEAIATEAEGNLLFIAELARHALSGAPESPRSGAGSLEAVVVERASHLPEVARRVLEVVATAQSPTAQRVVLAAASAIKGGVEAIAALRTHAFVRTSGPQPDDPVEPFHARIGAAIASSLDPIVRGRHHASLAEELARTDADAEVIAYHLVAAGDASRALGYLETASVQAVEALAFGRAIRLCTMALQHAVAADARRLALQHRLADALAFDGRGVQSARAYLVAADLAPPGEVLEFRRAAAEQLLRCGRLAEGQAELRRVLADLRLHVPTGPKEALAALLALRLKIRLRGTEFVERDEREIDRGTLLAVDTTFAAATGLLQSNVLFGQYFQAKHLVLALDAGEPHRLARALAMEGLYTATGGTRATVQTDLLNEQLAGLSRRLDDPRSGASSQLAAAVADVYRGRFAEALPRLEHAEEVFRRQCTNVHWEMSMVRMFRVMSLYYLGELTGMRRVIADALQDASDRDDLSTQLMLRASFQPLLYLLDDDLAGARGAFTALQAEHVASLGTATYRYSRMMTLSRIERYAGRGVPAWDAFGEHWAAVRRSLMLTKQPFKIFSVHDRALGALAAAAQSRGWTRRRLLFRARRDADVLDGERTRWSRTMALPIVASLAAERGNRDEAARIARDAERAFAEGGMQLYRFCMRRRHGECIRGTVGQDLVATADAALSDLGVVAPASLANMLVPTVRWST